MAGQGIIDQHAEQVAIGRRLSADDDDGKRFLLGCDRRLESLEQGAARAADIAHEKNRPRAQVERFESSDEATSSELFRVL